MVTISFSVFKEKILTNQKRQTIRKPRKHPIKVGDKLQLYWKLRIKETEFLREVVCKEILYVKFSDIKFDEEIAKNDGFENAITMRSLFNSFYFEINDNDEFVIIK